MNSSLGKLCSLTFKLAIVVSARDGLVELYVRSASIVDEVASKSEIFNNGEECK